MSSSKKMTLLLFCTTFITMSLSLDLKVEISNDWQRFKSIYGKTYKERKEEEKRKDTFQKNLGIILSHNILTDLGVHSYTLGVNEFTDMNDNDFAKLMGSVDLAPNYTTNDEVMVPTNGFTAPSSLDWRNSNAVTPVKNQGECGACWAFSVVDSVEGAWAIKNKELVELSTQNLLDCTTDNQYGNKGCISGNTNQAMKYIVDNGVNANSCYGYQGKVGSCSFKKDCKKVQISKIVTVPRDEKALLEALASNGPVSVGINADNNDFKFYKNGVYNPSSCSQIISHSVTLIGFGNQNGLDYWLCKNSWGTNWGENGFFKLVRNKGGMCGITRNAIYPVA